MRYGEQRMSEISNNAKLRKRPKPTTCRMFDTPFMEQFSSVHPASPFGFWIPVLIAISAWVLWQGPASPALPAWLLAGWLSWTLAEYVLHRWVFHYLGPKGWQRRFHFVSHGVHHDYPSDRGRLLMPLGISIPVGLAFFLLMAALAPLVAACTLFVGFGIGYLGYDGVHYFTHHFKARTRVGKFLKRFHLVHHHAGVDGLYGVSSPLWDYIFGTQRDLRESVRRSASKRAATSG